MSRTRILLLVDSINDTAGGAERFVVGLAQALSADRYEVLVATTRVAGGALMDELEAAGVRHIDVTRRTRFDVSALWRLFRTMRTEQIDIVHANKYGSNVWAVVFGRLARVPVVIAQEHTWAYSGERVRPFLDGRLIGPLSDAFVAVSTADRDRMISLEGVKASKIEVIPTAYIPREGADGDDVRVELGLDPGTPLIGTVAVLRQQKALQILIDAFAIVAHGRPDPHLVLAGTGVSEEELRAYAAASGVGDRIHFLGLRQDVNAVWRSIDVGAISSDFEGTPIAALEAMFNGTPLVTTSVGGLPDLIDDGVSGLLVPRRDPQALAAGLLRLLDAPQERAAFAQAAALRLDDYRLDRLVGRVEALYERLLARPGGRASRARREHP